MRPPTSVSDRLEFELRLIPGVIAVGSEGDGLVVTAASALAGGEAERFARARLGADVDVRIVTRAVGDSLEASLLRAVHGVPGVHSCRIEHDRSGGIEEVQVTVRSMRAGDRAHATVAAALGGQFAAERLSIALEIPLLEDSPVPR